MILASQSVRSSDVSEPFRVNSIFKTIQSDSSLSEPLRVFPSLFKPFRAFPSRSDSIRVYPCQFKTINQFLTSLFWKCPNFPNNNQVAVKTSQQDCEVKKIRRWNRVKLLKSVCLAKPFYLFLVYRYQVG